MVAPPFHTQKWSFLVGKPMVVGYHHFRETPLYRWWTSQVGGKWTKPRTKLPGKMRSILEDGFTILEVWRDQQLLPVKMTSKPNHHSYHSMVFPKTIQGEQKSKVIERYWDVRQVGAGKINKIFTKKNTTYLDLPNLGAMDASVTVDVPSLRIFCWNPKNARCWLWHSIYWLINDRILLGL